MNSWQQANMTRFLKLKNNEIIRRKRTMKSLGERKIKFSTLHPGMTIITSTYTCCILSISSSYILGKQSIACTSIIVNHFNWFTAIYSDEGPPDNSYALGRCFYVLGG